MGFIHKGIKGSLFSEYLQGLITIKITGTFSEYIPWRCPLSPMDRVLNVSSTARDIQ